MTILKDKLFFITGAGDGIGKQTALLAARKGAKLIVTDIDAASAEQTAQQIQAAGGTATAYGLDVTDREAFYALADEIKTNHGPVDMVMNNAGVALFATAEKMTQEELDWVMDINFFGTVNGCKAFLPHMLETGQGHIINLSSIFGLISVPNQSGYNASKFAVLGYSDALRQEMETQNINVTTVHPGGIKTRIAARARFMQMEGMEERRQQLIEDFDKITMTSPEKAAEIILRAVEKNKVRIRVGKDAVLVDWIKRLMPVKFSKLTNILLRIDG